jgi:hypothetical protein
VVAAVFLTLALNMVGQRLPVGMPVVMQRSLLALAAVVVALAVLAQVPEPLASVQATHYRRVPRRRMPLVVHHLECRRLPARPIVAMVETLTTRSASMVLVALALSSFALLQRTTRSLPVLSLLVAR